MSTENTKEKETVTGLDTATNRKDAEYDLVTSLLKAAEFKTDEENIHAVDIKRNGQLYFTINIHPIGDPDNRTARKKATTYAPHPNGAKYGKIEKDFESGEAGSRVSCRATTEEDQDRTGGNAGIMQKFDRMEPVESIDVLLTLGEKRKLLDLVTEISGINDDDEMDEETFQ